MAYELARVTPPEPQEAETLEPDEILVPGTLHYEKQALEFAWQRGEVSDDEYHRQMRTFGWKIENAEKREAREAAWAHNEEIDKGLRPYKWEHAIANHSRLWAGVLTGSSFGQGVRMAAEQPFVTSAGALLALVGLSRITAMLNKKIKSTESEKIVDPFLGTVLPRFESHDT